MKFSIQTFGCQMNVCDSDWLSRALRAAGWESADDAEAEVVIVNTCSVREKPEQKVYSQLGRLERQLADKPHGFIAVCGCVAQQIGRGFFDRFSRVRLVFGTDGLASAPGALVKLAAEPGLRISLLDFSEEYPERGRDYPGDDAPVSAFVNIMQGCDNYCAYCIVPYVRGPQKSRRPEAVLDECRELLDRGARELTLLGQNVNSYGQDAHFGTTFAQLLRMVGTLPGLERLRFTTSHPKDIDPEVIRAFGEMPTLCPHLHLPLQSGSDAVLRRMGRKYDTADYLRIVESLREARPDIALGTDLIVGFPGETRADFERTLAMMETVNFQGSFSFKYSDRPGTSAERMSPKVAPEEMTERLLELQTLQDKLTEAWYVGLEGVETDVLFERPSQKQVDGIACWAGRDGSRRIVNVACEDDLSGKLARVRIDKAKKHSLTGELVGRPW
jgi:tRNA-2-methylthio-N6-dimethylallyladenosine synthase